MNAAAEIDAYAEGKTIPLVFLDMLAHNGPRVAFRWKASSESGDAWSEVTWDLFADDVARAAAGLAARGLGRGDRLMLMLRNVYEFHVLDTAALFLGATPVSIYNSSAVEQVRYLVSDAGATLAVVENDAFLRLFQAARPDLPRLTGVGVVSSNGTVSSNESGAGFTYADLLSAEPLDLATAAGNANPDDLATLIYTSGTTGPSKGVMIDHRNVVWTAECLRRSFGWEAERMAGMRVISYLPMAHIAERMVSHYQSLAFGYEITCCPDPTLIAAYAGEVRPQVMFGVPRVWEKIYAGVNAALAADPDKQRAVNDGIASAAPLERKITMGTASQEELDTYQFLDDVAFRLIRELVGLDQLQAAITGAAPIPAEILSKPARLNELEFELIKTHAAKGAGFIKHVDHSMPLADMIRQHHERMDGSGYPDGLRADEILPEARIIGVADVVEAMSGHRPYRPALGIDAAAREIQSGRGSRYDTDVATACLDLISDGTVSRAMSAGHSGR